jgi:hypothetical protein
VVVEAEAERVDLALAEALSRASYVLARQLGRTGRPARVPPELVFDPAT